MAAPAAEFMTLAEELGKEYGRSGDRLRDFVETRRQKAINGSAAGALNWEDQNKALTTELASLRNVKAAIEKMAEAKGLNAPGKETEKNKFLDEQFAAAGTYAGGKWDATAAKLQDEAKGLKEAAASHTLTPREKFKAAATALATAQNMTTGETSTFVEAQYNAANKDSKTWTQATSDLDKKTAEVKAFTAAAREQANAMLDKGEQLLIGANPASKDAFIADKLQKALAAPEGLVAATDKLKKQTALILNPATPATGTSAGTGTPAGTAAAKPQQQSNPIMDFIKSLFEGIGGLLSLLTGGRGFVGNVTNMINPNVQKMVEGVSHALQPKTKGPDGKALPAKDPDGKAAASALRTYDEGLQKEIDGLQTQLKQGKIDQAHIAGTQDRIKSLKATHDANESAAQMLGKMEAPELKALMEKPYTIINKEGKEEIYHPKDKNGNALKDKDGKEITYTIGDMLKKPNQQLAAVTWIANHEAERGNKIARAMAGAAGGLGGALAFDEAHPGRPVQAPPAPGRQAAAAGPMH